MKTLMAFLVGLFICHTAYSAELFGTVDAMSGTASLSGVSGKTDSVYIGQQILAGQTLNTSVDGEVHVVTVDGGFIALRRNTSFRVDEYKAEGNSSDKIFMSLLKGAIRSITGWIGKHNTSAYQITTPGATIGIRGTDHETTVIEAANGDEPGTYDTVNEGSTVLKTPHGEAEVHPGKFAFAPKGRAVAPHLLEKQPDFLANRKLKIEDRIEQRKNFLRSNMEKMRNERIERVKQLHSGTNGQAREQTARAREHKPDQLERSGEARNKWSGQAGQRRENMRNEAKRRHDNEHSKTAERPKRKYAQNHRKQSSKEANQ